MDDGQPDTCYDERIGAWIVSNYADVSAALRDRRLAPLGFGGGGNLDFDISVSQVTVRRAAKDAFSPEHLDRWRTDFDQSARTLVEHLPPNEPIDLIAAFAAPWSRSLALQAAGANAGDADALHDLARTVFRAAAASTDGEPTATGIAAAAELSQRLHVGNGHSSMDVQSFVALSQTLPALLAGAWLELFKNSDIAGALHVASDLAPKVVDELLRLGGPSRAVFRYATSGVTIGARRIETGQRIALMLSRANRDPARFPRPDQFDLDRGADGHLALGRGDHSCVGASIVRLALATATRALLQTTTSIELVGGDEWLDGFAIRAPLTVRAVLRRERRHDHIQNSQRAALIT